jgi:hypothetical protein
LYDAGWTPPAWLVGERSGGDTCRSGEPLEETERRVIFARVYSRIVGYLTAVDDWNAGKRQEFAERVVYDPARQPAQDAQDGEAEG